MKSLGQTAIVLGAAVVVILFVLRERLADWVSPPHFESRTTTGDQGDPWVFVCPMDGFQRKDPGPCLVPACGGMPLTEEHRMRKSQLNRANAISLTSAMIQTVGLRTETVDERELVRHLRTVGKITADERLTRDITARVEGRLERIYKNFVGAELTAGEPLAEIYSPDLVTTQEEYLIAKKGGDEKSVEAAMRRWTLWGFREEQLREIENEGKARTRVPFMAPLSGVVSKLGFHEGHWAKAGDDLMEVVDLSSVWLQADIYEHEIAFVQLGQKVEVAAPAHPGQKFEGKISYIHSFLDEKTRTLHVRIDIPNPGRKLLPGMFVEAEIHAPLGPGGSPIGPDNLVEVDEFFCHLHGPSDDPAKCPKCGGPMDVRKTKKPLIKEETVYVCGACCPDVKEPKGGKCPKCPMQLTPKKVVGVPRSLAVPRGAVLDSGQKSYVFVEIDPRKYRRTEVVLGPRAGEWVPVKSGLKKGDVVVSQGAYLLDSQSQISSGASALFSGATEVKSEHKH